MKTIILFSLAFMYSFVLYSQRKEINNAIKKGVTRSGYFEVHVPAKKKMEEKKLRSYCKSSNIELKKVKVENVFSFGTYIPCVTYFSFTTPEEIARQAEARKQREERQRILAQQEKQRKIEQENQRRIAVYNSAKAEAKKLLNSNPNWKLIEYSDGFFIGNVENGIPNGNGKYVWKITDPYAYNKKNCDYYIGQFKNGKINGKGELYYYAYCNFDIELFVHTGTFRDGKKHGEGYVRNITSTGLLGCPTYYEGLWSDGQIIRNYTAEQRDAKEQSDRNNVINAGNSNASSQINSDNFVEDTDWNGYKYKQYKIEFNDYTWGYIYYGVSQNKWYLSLPGIFDDGSPSVNREEIIQKLWNKEHY